MGPGISIWRVEFLTYGWGCSLLKLTYRVHKAQGGLSRGLSLNLIFQKKLCVPFWLFQGIWFPMVSQNQLPIVFSPCLNPTLRDVFPATFMKPEKFTMRKMFVLSLEKLGEGAQNGRKPSRPPDHSLHWLFFWMGRAPVFILGSYFFFFFSLKTLELSSQKIASAQGTAGQECSHWV